MLMQAEKVLSVCALAFSNDKLSKTKGLFCLVSVGVCRAMFSSVLLASVATNGSPSDSDLG